MANDNKQRAQDAMWDALTEYGTSNAQTAHHSYVVFEKRIEVTLTVDGRALLICNLFADKIQKKLMQATAQELCDAFADLGQELYEAKEAELMKGY